MYNINIKLLLFLFFSCFNLYAQGLGDWTCKTKNGSLFSHNGSGVFLKIKNQKELRDLKKWYFYKNNIVTELNNKTFAVIDEVSGNTSTFKEKPDLEKNIIQINENIFQAIRNIKFL